MCTLPKSIWIRHPNFTHLFIVFVMVFLWSSTATFARAQDYTFSWSANPEPVTGYKLYYKKGGEAGPPFNGTGAQQAPSPISVGKKTGFTITGLQNNTTYHFAITAINNTTESDFSQVITVLPQDSTPAPALPAPTIKSIKIK